MQVSDVMSHVLTPEESAEFDARMAALAEQPPTEDRWDIHTYADGTWTAMHSRQWGFQPVAGITTDHVVEQPFAPSTDERWTWDEQSQQWVLCDVSDDPPDTAAR